MNPTGMTKHNATIDSIMFQVQLNTKYHDGDYRRRIKNLLLIARKTYIVNRDVCHLYSLQKNIAPDDIDNFYPVKLETRLSQILSSKSYWIQRMQLSIYDSLN